MAGFNLVCVRANASFAVIRFFQRLVASVAWLSALLPGLAFAQAQMSTPGTAGMQPSLALTYNSQAGNGLGWMGWSLSGLSAIHRCPATIDQDGFAGSLNYDANDRFCLDGERLIRINMGLTYGAPG